MGFFFGFSLVGVFPVFVQLRLYGVSPYAIGHGRDNDAGQGHTCDGGRSSGKSGYNGKRMHGLYLVARVAKQACFPQQVLVNAKPVLQDVKGSAIGC